MSETTENNIKNPNDSENFNYFSPDYWNQPEDFELQFSDEPKVETVAEFHFLKQYLAIIIMVVAAVFFAYLGSLALDFIEEHKIMAFKFLSNKLDNAEMVKKVLQNFITMFKSVGRIIFSVIYIYVPCIGAGLALINTIIAHIIWGTTKKKNLAFNTCNLFGQMICLAGAVYISFLFFSLKLPRFIILGILNIIVVFWLIITGDKKKKTDW